MLGIKRKIKLCTLGFEKGSTPCSFPGMTLLQDDGKTVDVTFLRAMHSVETLSESFGSTPQ